MENVLDGENWTFISHQAKKEDTSLPKRLRTGRLL